jgi:hypothetical protein
MSAAATYNIRRLSKTGRGSADGSRAVREGFSAVDGQTRKAGRPKQLNVSGKETPSEDRTLKTE